MTDLPGRVVVSLSLLLSLSGSAFAGICDGIVRNVPLWPAQPHIELAESVNGSRLRALSDTRAEFTALEDTRLKHGNLYQVGVYGRNTLVRVKQGIVDRQVDSLNPKVSGLLVFNSPNRRIFAHGKFGKHSVVEIFDEHLELLPRGRLLIDSTNKVWPFQLQNGIYGVVLSNGTQYLFSPSNPDWYSVTYHNWELRHPPEIVDGKILRVRHGWDAKPTDFQYDDRVIEGGFRSE